MIQLYPYTDRCLKKLVNMKEVNIKFGKLKKYRAENDA